ncbi:hypothetical protein T08_9190, partial [Trichinella sp. T8]
MAGEPAKKASSGTSSRTENAELNSRSTRAIKQEISSRANCFIPETKQYLSAEVLLILNNATGHPENLKLQITVIDGDSHLDVVDCWKKFNNADWMCLINEYIIKLKTEAVNDCWGNLWPDYQLRFFLLITMTVTLAHQVNKGSLKDLQELEVMVLIESHTNELTYSGDHIATGVNEKLTFEKLVKILHAVKRTKL